MTGPEHYREAERLLAPGEYDEGDDSALLAQDIARAQVHATLALAAATAMNDASGGMGVRDWDDWRDAASLSKPTNLDHEDPS